MRFHTKGFTSLFLTITFVAIGLSGGVLYIAPRCRVAEQIGWTVMGLGKDQWESLHINGGLFFILAGLLHVVLNWSILWGYITKRGETAIRMKRELSVAVLLGAAMIAGSLLGVAPFRSVVELHDSIKDSWGGPPGGSGRMSVPAATLRDLADELRISEEQLSVVLEAEGWEFVGLEATLCEVAERNDVTVEQVRRLVQNHFPERQPRGGRGEGSGGGRGLGGGRGQGGGGGGGGCGAGGSGDTTIEEG